LPTISVVNSAAVAGHCAHVVPVNSWWFLLPMAPEKRKWELMRRAGVMLPVARRRYSGTTLEKTALLMMLQPFALLSVVCLMVQCCVIILRAMLAAKWGPLDILNNNYFVGRVVVP
jgi:hypothetical protein